MREFAQNYLKYENDLNNYSLYVWGYAMLMIDYYKITGDMGIPTYYNDWSDTDALQINTYGLPN